MKIGNWKTGLEKCLKCLELKEVNSCLGEMKENGVPFKGRFALDGRVHRFQVVGSRDRAYYAAKEWLSKGFLHLACIYGCRFRDKYYEYFSWQYGDRDFPDIKTAKEKVNALRNVINNR